MSYRGRVLIINNLIASVLWHKLAILEPPIDLLIKIQRILVDFVWDQMHWIPQSVLFLSRECGGQGLIHLVRRKAAFRIQFVQKFLYGNLETPCRVLAGRILKQVGNLGLRQTIFLLDTTFLNVRGFFSFYCSVFRAWSVVERRRLFAKKSSLFWLLEEPIVYGS